MLINNACVITLLAITVTKAEMGDVTNPNSVEVRLGEQAALICKTRIDFKFCSFKSPSGKGYTMDSAIHYDRITYHGDNLLRDCGMKIAKVSEEDNGQWKCEVTFVMEDGAAHQEDGQANITVLRTPQTLQVEVDGKEVENLIFEYTDMAEKVVTCIAKEGRPAPSFFWKLGDVVIEGGAITEFIGEDGTTTVEQDVRLRALPKHNNKHLTCIVNHKGYTDEQKEYGKNEKAVTLDVRFKPILDEDEVETKPGNASLKFLSNPGPQEIEWQLQDLDGKTTVKKTPDTWCSELNSSRFCYATDFIESGPTMDHYIARILFNESHPLVKGKVTIINGIGEVEKSFTIGMLKSDHTSQKDLLASENKLVIIIVILTILSVIVIIIMLLIARHNRIFCFSPASSVFQKKESISVKETANLTPTPASKTYRSSVRLERD